MRKIANFISGLEPAQFKQYENTMEYLKAKIIKLLVDFFEEDYRRISHALSVLEESEHILKTKNDCDEEIVIACALLHDVGIKPSEKKLGYNNGKTQEQFGPSEAEKLLSNINFSDNKIKKIKEIIGNHHSPSKYDYPELKVLKQADKIINLREKEL